MSAERLDPTTVKEEPMITEHELPITPGDARAGGSAALEMVAAAITGRRSVKAYQPRPAPRDLIARLIDLAVWAPNHRLNEPWRFYILDGASRARLGEVARRVTLARLGAVPGVDSVPVAQKAAAVAEAWASVPTLLYLTVLTDPNPEVDLENYGAACCAAQNFMLAAHAAGLATSWSSGALAAADELRALVGAGPGERMVGLFRLGYPDPAVPSSTGRRGPGATRTVWVDEHPGGAAGTLDC